MRRAIVNADDFGWSVGVTDGILRAHREGIVTSTTLAANMPDASRAASCAAGLPALGVGVHLNACQGRPLSPDAESLTNGQGLLCYTGPGLIARCLRRHGTVTAVLAEFEAQIRRVLDLGLCPTHLDSHRHVHAWPPLWAGVARLARRYGVRHVRRPMERLPGHWPAPPARQRRTATLLRMIGGLSCRPGQTWPSAAGTWGIAHTGCIDASWLILAAGRLGEGVTEIMVHPGFPDDLDEGQTRLLDSRRVELEALCDPLVKQAFVDHHVELVHYGQL